MKILILSILSMTGGELIIIVLGVICLLASLVAFVLKQVAKNKINKNVAKLMETSEKLSLPCKVIVFRDSSEMPKKEWQYAISLNNEEKRFVNDGYAIEFSTSFKNNALAGYGRSDYVGISRHPSLDSPFIFEAVEDGIVKIILKPTFDYSGGNGIWKSNFSSSARGIKKMIWK